MANEKNKNENNNKITSKFYFYFECGLTNKKLDLEINNSNDKISKTLGKLFQVYF